MRRYFSVLVMTLPLSTLAATITYDELRSQSLGDASPSNLIGRSIQVNPVNFSDLGFYTAKSKDIYFACESGDKSLISTDEKPKPKVVPFYGVTKRAQGWDGSTIWYLDNCRIGSMQTSVPKQPSSSSGVLALRIKGDGDQTGSPDNAKLRTVEGIIFRDRDPGGWFYGVELPNKKSVKVTYEHSENYKVLSSLEEKGVKVAVSGYIGIYSDGDQAFDTARDIEIRAIQTAAVQSVQPQIASSKPIRAATPNASAASRTPDQQISKQNAARDQCISRVQQTYGTSSSIQNMAAQAVAQAQALRECDKLANGEGTGPRIAAMNEHEKYVEMARRIEELARRIAAGRNMACPGIAQQLLIKLKVLGPTSTELQDEIRAAEEYGCL